jgi:hypothetical protein
LQDCRWLSSCWRLKCWRSRSRWNRTWSKRIATATQCVGVGQHLFSRHDHLRLQLVIDYPMVANFAGYDVFADKVQTREFVPRCRNRLQHSERLEAVFDQTNLSRAVIDKVVRDRSAANFTIIDKHARARWIAANCEPTLDTAGRERAKHQRCGKPCRARPDKYRAQTGQTKTHFFDWTARKLERLLVDMKCNQTPISRQRRVIQGAKYIDLGRLLPGRFGLGGRSLETWLHPDGFTS